MLGGPKSPVALPPSWARLAFVRLSDDSLSSGNCAARHPACATPRYRATHRGNLTLDDVKHRFLDTPPSPETGSLFTYTLARLMNIARLPNIATTNRFSGQLEINILFDITLVVEEAIKDKNPTKRYPER